MYGGKKRPYWAWWENLKEREYLEDTSVDEDNIKLDLQEVGYGP